MYMHCSKSYVMHFMHKQLHISNILFIAELSKIRNQQNARSSQLSQSDQVCVHMIVKWLFVYK